MIVIVERLYELKMIKVFLSLVTIHGVLSAARAPYIQYELPLERNLGEGGSVWNTLQQPEPSAELNDAEKFEDQNSFPGPSDIQQGIPSSSLVFNKVTIPSFELELPRYEYNQGWWLQPIEQNRLDSEVIVNIQSPSTKNSPYFETHTQAPDTNYQRPSSVDARFATDAPQPAPYPPAPEPAPYPPAPEPAPYPPAPEPTPYPPAPEPAPYPPAFEPAPYPPAPEPTPYPPASEPAPYPPAPEPTPYPPAPEPAPYPPAAEPVPYPPAAEPAPYPPASEPVPYPPAAEPAPYPPAAEPVPYPSATGSDSYQYPPQKGVGLLLGEKGSDIDEVALALNGQSKVPSSLTAPNVSPAEVFNGGEESGSSSIQSQSLSPAPGTSNSLVIPTGTKVKVQDKFGQYSHGFANPDGTKIQESGHLISTDNGWEYVIAQEGSYSYLSPEGIPIYVRYIADDKGFRILSQGFSSR